MIIRVRDLQILPMDKIFFIFYILSYLLSKKMGCFSGRLMFSVSDQKLFCAVCSGFKCSFDEFVGRKWSPRPIPPPSWLLPQAAISWVGIMLPASAPPPGWAGEFSCPCVVKLGPHIVFYVCREHVLGIITLLSSLGWLCVSCHHCFIVWGHVSCFCCLVLLLSTATWFSS